MKTPKPIHKNVGGTKSCLVVKKQTTTVKFTPTAFINIPSIIDESIKIVLLEKNSKISKFLLDLYFGKFYEKYKKNPTSFFIFLQRLNDMSIKISQAINSDIKLETYGGKTVRNSKYDAVEKLIVFYKDFATQLYEFIKTNKVVKQEDIALAIECKCCQKYLNLHGIKDFINYDSYRKIQYLIDKKNCHIKVVNRKEAKRKFGRCKSHIETLQHTLF
ncbi:hypothetical protein ACE193_21370 [Bernardetia sp. OM2101]|uniref:hypothetical protein n=1 Tax=Bernardetia sp. OM2101 TaxID=3344876 RepID=UPI0035D02CD7